MLILVEKLDGKLRWAGIADAGAAHRNGWCHTTVLGMPVLAGTSPAVVLLYKRGERRKSSPGKLDLDGSGHVEFSLDQDLGVGDLEAMIMRNAIKEAQEELRPDRSYEFAAATFHRFGKLGEWEHSAADNREMSTLHVIRLPNGCSWLIGDSNQDFVQPVEFTLEELMSRFRNAPDDFADGVSRVLSKFCRDAELQASFQELLAEVAEG
jgi:hypothetical protein